MNLKIISVISDRDNEGHRQLIRSLKHYGYDYTAMIHPFSFGGQMQYVYEYAKNNWGWFLYTDGWDTFALAGPDEVISKLPEGVSMLISAEKNCYPHAEKSVRYPACETEWKYVNGGGFMADCAYFAKVYEDSHDATYNDQDWLTEVFLAGKAALDTRCEIFQTIAFEGQEDFTRMIVPSKEEPWKNSLRMRNNKTRSLPIFIHGNAHTPMEKIYKLL